MEHIDGSIVRHDRFHVGEGIEQELVESIVCHVIVLDLPGGAFVVHVVRRVGQHKVGLLAVHQDVVGFLLRGVPTDQPVPSKRPHVARLGEGRLLELGFDVKIVVMETVL